MNKMYGCVAGALLLLSGCSSEPNELPKPQPLYLEGQIQQIQTAGIQIIQQGDRIILIIPTDLYFEPGTAKVKESRQKTLQDVAIFVKKSAGDYPNSVIRVIGYTDQVLGIKSQQELSQSYAEAISAYLFNAGVNPKRIAIEGRGSREPVAGQTSPRSATQNRRVMIQVN